MRRFALVFVQEFKETLRSKPFIIISVFFVVMLMLAAVVGFILTGFGSGPDSGLAEAPELNADYAGEDDPNGLLQPEHSYSDYLYFVAVNDRIGDDTLGRLSERMPAFLFREMELDEATVEEMLAGDNIDAYMVLDTPEHFDIYEPADLYGYSLGGMISEALTEVNRIRMLEQLGIGSDDACSVIESGEAWYTVHAIGGYNMGGYVYNYVMVVLMFLVIALYGQMVATRVASEKSSRTMEVLATSVSPAELLCGKVMGVGAAGLLQISVFILAAVGLIKGMLARAPLLSVVAAQLLDISVFDIACLVLYFVLGFLLYAFIFGAMGSMVSRTEDLSGVVSLPTYLFMIGYFIAMFASLGGETNALMKIASFVPFWSPVTMFSRMSVEEVPLAQVAISMLILVITAAAAAWLSARIYRSGMLRYGKPPRIKEIINAARNGR